jgi:hypothetical protein
MGGCESFVFAPTINISAIPEAINQVVSSAITGTLLNGLSIIDTLELEEQQAESNSGDYYKILIKGLVPKLTAEYLDLFNKLKQYRHIVVVKDNNGKKIKNLN